ncbi:EB module [Necator americanus]|uniref:EB module n=1 Tax=Necator americanus TaxID=51031 RepID=W2TUR9_NECAM|nr:EB module [Necator americanus]ETN85845.1 EB module [Necator americanus]
MSLLIASSLLAFATAQYAPIAPVPGMCSPSCIGGAACVAGACQCTTPAAVYSPVVGCAPMPVAPIPVAPGPVVAGRLIPQALPGSPCEPGVECTGGSVCSLGICVCPPELVQEGTVCISRTIYSVIPPPPPAVIVPAIPAVPVAAPLALGAPCYAAPTPCVSGAVCSAGVCQCSPAYTPVAGGCVRRTGFVDLNRL